MMPPHEIIVLVGRVAIPAAAFWQRSCDGSLARNEAGLPHFEGAHFPSRPKPPKGSKLIRVSGRHFRSFSIMAKKRRKEQPNPEGDDGAGPRRKVAAEETHGAVKHQILAVLREREFVSADDI